MLLGVGIMIERPLADLVASTHAQAQRSPLGSVVPCSSSGAGGGSLPSHVQPPGWELRRRCLHHQSVAVGSRPYTQVTQGVCCSPLSAPGGSWPWGTDFSGTPVAPAIEASIGRMASVAQRAMVAASLSMAVLLPENQASVLVVPRLFLSALQVYRRSTLNPQRSSTRCLLARFERRTKWR